MTGYQLITGEFRCKAKYATAANNQTQLQITLPQIELPAFSSNYAKFQADWGQFYAAVHSRADIVDVTIFSYPKSTLKGAAATLLEGFLLINNSYKNVVDLLLTTYQHKESVQSYSVPLIDISTLQLLHIR